jgi:hypothetical protein
MVSIALALAARVLVMNVSPRSPAVAVQRCVEIVQLRRGCVRNAVDVRVDRMTVSGGIDADDDARALGNCDERCCHNNRRDNQ